MENMFSLEGKTALVTGAAYGIGLAIATALSRAGARIYFNCSRQETIDRGLAAYKELGIDAKGFLCDVTDEEAVRKMVAKIEAEAGAIDILVNNAGIIKRIPMEEMAVEDFRRVVDIDLVGPFICSKAVIPGMIRKGHGKIINICSMMSELGRETVSAYAAAKGGLKMLTIYSVTASGRATSPQSRQLRCVSVRPTEAVIPSTPSSYPRLRLPAGERPRTSWARLYSWRLTPRISSTATCFTSMAVSLPI